jgi:hypothetical protein
MDRGYSLASFHNALPRERHLILRHDVDQCIKTARRLADIEAGEGWTSTWFVLVRSAMYNPFSKENVEHLRSMLAAGHEIGLHLDATLYASNADLDAGAAVECRMLEDVVGTPVRVISFHRPSKVLLGDGSPVAGRIHTYMPRFFSEIGYSSDSRGEWRYGFPWDHAAVNEGRALQLLTHAIWWIGPDHRQGRERLEDLIASKMTEFETELAANSDVWLKTRE